MPQSILLQRAKEAQMQSLQCLSRFLGVAAVLCSGAFAFATAARADGGAQRWFSAHSAQLTTDGAVRSFPLPQPRSGPTTLAIAPDGRVWFTESSGNRIGRMNPAAATWWSMRCRIRQARRASLRWAPTATCGSRSTRVTASGALQRTEAFPNSIFQRRRASRGPSRWAPTATSGSGCSLRGRSGASPLPA